MIHPQAFPFVEVSDLIVSQQFLATADLEFFITYYISHKAIEFRGTATDCRRAILTAETALLCNIARTIEDKDLSPPKRATRFGRICRRGDYMLRNHFLLFIQVSALALDDTN